MSKQITVQGVIVDVTTPYAEGHTINEAEAKALNQVRAENIRNNTAKSIKGLLEAEGATVESIAKEAQKLVTDYDKQYVFTLASVGGGTRLDPLTKECRRLARDYISNLLKREGETVKAYKEKNGDDAYNAKIIELSEHPKVVETAKAELKKREAMAAETADFKL